MLIFVFAAAAAGRKKNAQKNCRDKEEMLDKKKYTYLLSQKQKQQRKSMYIFQ